MKNLSLTVCLIYLIAFLISISWGHAQTPFDSFEMTFGGPYSYTTPATVAGVSYSMKVSGTFRMGCCEPELDAAFFFKNQVTPFQAINWLWNGNAVAPSPNTYNPNHEYWYYFTGDGNPQTFTFTDTPYSDNAGSLQFEISLAFSETNTIPTNGLVGWFPFNGNANDESGNGKNGDVTGAILTSDRFGKLDSAYDFNGDSNYIAIPPLASGSNSNQMTISMWVNHTENTDHQSFFTINGGTWILKMLNTNQIRVYNGNSSYSTIINSSIQNNSWYHLGLTFQGLELKAYLNGKLVQTNTMELPVSWTDDYVFLGASGWSSGNYFKGKMDDVGVWNRALTESEVMQLYSSDDASNTSPKNISLSYSSISENLPIGSTVGTLNTTDDEGGAMSYSLVSGVGANDNASFSIDGDKLKAATVFDYETKSSYSIWVRTTDSGGLSFEKQFTISVTDVFNESIPTNGLVAWYPFNGNANDESGNGNHGIVNGANLTADRFGNSNKAYQFSQDFIQVNPDPIFNFSEAMTVNLWYLNNGEGGVFVSKHQRATLNSSYVLYNESFCGPTGYITDTGNNIQFVRDELMCDLVNWHMLTMTFNYPNLSVYLDGVLIGSKVTEKIKATSFPILFGGTTDPSQANGVFANFTGKLDDIIFYDRGISSDEVLQLYSSNMVSNTSPKNISLSYSSISENLPIGSTVGTLNTTDDEGGAMSYLLVSGVGANDNASFSIDGDKLKAATVFDYETKSSFSIRARTTDSGGLSFEKQFTISVTDVLNESIPTNGLVAWYPFNGNANDESGNNLNGEVRNAQLTTDRFGNTNKAYYFTEEQDIIIPGTENMNPFPLTVSLWYNSDLLRDGENANIFSKYVPAAWNGFQILLGDFRNVPNNENTHNNGFGIAPWYLRSTTDRVIGYYGEPPFVQPDVVTNSWYHFVFTIDETGGKIFINGELIDQHPWTGQSGSSTSSFLWRIGGFYHTWFNGKIDDIGIWNRALTSNEVDQLYSASKQVQTITFNNLNPKTYGDVAFSLPATSTSGLDITYTSSDPNVASVSGSTVTIKSAGTTIITASQDGNDVYGPALPVQQTFTVNKATLTATAANKGRVYGDANPAFTITYTGFKNSETSTVIDTAPAATTTATLNSNVGNYNIVPAGGTDNNYTFSYVSGTLTINKAILTATAVNKSRLYGEANPVLTITYNGFKNGETSLVIDALPTAATAATQLSNVGTFSIEPSGGTDDNYSFSYVSGTLTINKAMLTATAVNKSRVYGDPNPAFTIAYTGFVNGETSTVIDTPPSAITSATQSSNVGTYNVVPSGGIDNNYSFIYVNGTLTITKAILIAAADNKSRLYGEANPVLTITYNGFKNGETSLVIDALPTAATAATQSSNVGTFSIEPSGGTDDNYSFSYVSGTLTINKAMLTATAVNKSRVYGDPNPAFTTAYTGFVNGETSTVIDTPPSAITSATQSSNVGTYNVVPSGGIDNNYSFIYVSGTLTITKAILIATADNKSRLYGEANPVLTITYTGFKNGETSSVIDALPTAATAATQSNNVGTFSIEPSGGTDNNYSFSYVSGTLTINKAMLTAIAVSKGRVYGDPNPALTIAYTGFVNGETSTVIDTPPSAITSATQSSNVGTYNVVPAGGFDNNYSFAFVSGTFSIIKATLSARADNKTKILGEENPVLTLTYNGFKNSDTYAVIDSQPIVSTTADETSLAGTYTISVSGGADNNYDFTYVSGILTIENVITDIFDEPSFMFGLYPNPATDFIIIKLTSDQSKTIKKLQVYSGNGTKIDEIRTSTQEEVLLDLSTYSKGAYMIILKFENRVSVLRFMKN